jgi:diamine N-acetyltransferase
MEAEQPILSIVGEKVALGPLPRDLLPLYLKWFNDFEYLRTTGQVRPMSREALEAEFERAIKAENQIEFVIYEASTLRPIGGVNLHNVNHFHHRAEFGIDIGEKDCWGKGYATEATRLMLDYGFTILGLETINLWVLPDNQRGIRTYRRAGFRESGRWRKAYGLGSQAHDIIYMDCLAEEFESPVLHRLLPTGDRGEPPNRGADQ